MRKPGGARLLSRVVLGLLVLPVVAGACSSASPASSASTSSSNSPSSSTVVVSTTTTLEPATGPGGAVHNRPAPSASQTACALISPSEIKATMGTIVGQPHAVVSGSVTTCTYKSPTLTKSVIIEYDVAASAKTFAAGRSEIEQHGATTTSITGLGTQAYSFSLSSTGSPVNTVVTFQGTLQTIVSSTSPLQAVQNMAEEISYQIVASHATTTTVAAG